MKVKQAHPFPKYYIEAHSGSSVVVDCSGNTNIGKGTDAPLDEMEADLLRVFRSLTLRERVDLMRHIYRKADIFKKKRQ